MTRSPDHRPPANIESDGEAAERSHQSLRPSRPRRVSAMLAGYRDGRADVLPDAATGHTAYTATIQDYGRTGARAELLELATELRPVLQRLARLDLEPIAHSSRDPAGLVSWSHPEVPAEVARVRLERERRRYAAEHAVLADLVANLEQATDQRIRRWAECCQQLVDIYWRALLRGHPEAAEVRENFPVPVVALPGVHGLLGATARERH